MWRMIENSYTTVEFDFRPNSEQLERARERSALIIQRLWRQIRSSREMRRVGVMVPDIILEDQVTAAPTTADETLEDPQMEEIYDS